MPFRKHHRRVRLALLTAGLAAAIAPPADAGTYDVWSCRTPQGSAAAIGDASYGWQAYQTGHNFLSNENHCGDGGGYFGSRFVGAQPVGAAVRWTFVAPPATTISSYEMHWAGSAGGTNGVSPAVGDISLQRSDQGDPNYVERYYGGGAFRSVDSPLSDNNRAAQAGLNVSSFKASGVCSPSAGQSGNCAPGDVNFRIFRSRVALHDSSSPGIGSISGEALDEGVFSGTETLTLNATDTGSGVYRLIVNLDGTDTLFKVINTDGGRCADIDASNASPYEFTAAQPCPLSNSGDVEIDTTQLPEGAHTLRLKVEDAAGNKTTAYGPVTKTVDNVPPPQPTTAPSVAGTAKEGNVLVADKGAWSGDGVTFTYQWERCDAAGANCVAIPGATGQTYTVTAEDAGKRVRVLITAKNGEGTTTAASSPTGVAVDKNGNTGSSSSTNTATTNSASSTSSTTNTASSRELLEAGALNGYGASAGAKVTATYGSQRSVRTKYGKRVLVTGRVLNEHGTPITGAVLDVIERPRGTATLRVVGTVVSASDGSFSYLLPVGASRMVRFAYRFRGGDAVYAHTTDVEVSVTAVVKARASRAVRGRQPLKFRGTVRGARKGAFVLLQAKVGRRWQIFERARIGANGAFRASYVFRRTRVRTTFAFRVLYAGKDGSNLNPARSKVMKVRYTP
jgi:hypothetical protein